MTGLAAGRASGLPIFEAEAAPGGICSSYYIRPGSSNRLSRPPRDGGAYRFEIGGGHWIFGGDPAVLRLIRQVAPTKEYSRVSSVYFPQQNLYVPYPLQNHLRCFDRELRSKALVEILTAPKPNFQTMADWLTQSFGATLTAAFFGPFHELYTAGLWKTIAPQDPYKSPIDAGLVIRGASDATPAIGYNTRFLYPQAGLNALAHGLARGCEVHYGRRAARIDVAGKTVHFDDGPPVKYESLISTLPLNRMIEMAGLKLEAPPDPYTSVLVLNIGGVRGERCPPDHWLYVPVSRAGFHRVGFYTNVDKGFLPRSARKSANRVGIYVERAYQGGRRPAANEVQDYSAATVRELQDWGYLGEVEALDPTWIDVAYTWSWPGSRWRNAALSALEKHDIQMVGRYARWTFQGIADSIRDGLYVGAANSA